MFAVGADAVLKKMAERINDVDVLIKISDSAFNRKELAFTENKIGNKNEISLNLNEWDNGKTIKQILSKKLGIQSPPAVASAR